MAGYRRAVTREADVEAMRADGLAAALISAHTYSSGEALAYHFRSQRLGPVVGEPTPGAADHVTPVVLAPHVRANLPPRVRGRRRDGIQLGAARRAPRRPVLAGGGARA